MGAISHAMSQVKSAAGRAARYLLHEFRDWQTWLPVLLIAASAFSMRFVVESNHVGPSGSDYGNYLTNVAILWGNDVTGGGVQYPPLFLLSLSALLVVFDPLTALQISGPLLAAIVAFPGYGLMRLYAERALSLAGTALLALADPFSEMIGWGANPQLLATVFTVLFLRFGILGLETRSRRHVVLAGLALSLVAGSHQVSILYVLLLMAFVAGGVALVLRRGAAPSLRAGIEVTGWGVLFSLPYVPAYLHVSSRLAPFAPANFITPDVGILVTNALFVLRYEALWIPLIAVAIIGYRKMLPAQPVRAIVGFWLLLAPFPLTLTIFAFHPARPLYFIPLGVAPGVVAALQLAFKAGAKGAPLWRSRMTKRAITLITIAVVVTVASASYVRMEAASSFYYVLGPDMVEAMRWLRDQTQAESRIITNGPTKYGPDELTGCKWGWWIEGFASRKTLCTVPLPFLSYIDQVTDSNLANLVFVGRHTASNEYWRVGDNGPHSAGGNPLLFGNFAAGFKGVAYFDDSATGLDLGSGAERPLSWPGRSYVEVANSTVARIEVSYNRTGLSFTRTVELRTDSRSVTVSIEIRGPTLQVTIPLFLTSNSRFGDIDFSGRRVEVVATGDFNDENTVQLRVSTLNATLGGVSPPSFQESTAQVEFLFSLQAGNSTIQFDFAHQGNTGATQGGVMILDSTTLLLQASIDFVFVERTRTRDVLRFGADPSLVLAFQNREIAIFGLRGIGGSVGLNDFGAWMRHD